MSSSNKHEPVSMYAAKTRPAAADVSLPDDIGPVRDPGNAWQCWAVTSIRTFGRITGKRCQCTQRRQAGRQKTDPKRYTCVAHKGQEAAAEELASRTGGAS